MSYYPTLCTPAELEPLMQKVVAATDGDQIAIGTRIELAFNIIETALAGEEPPERMAMLMQLIHRLADRVDTSRYVLVPLPSSTTVH